MRLLYAGYTNYATVGIKMLPMPLHCYPATMGLKTQNNQNRIDNETTNTGLTTKQPTNSKQQTTNLQ